MSEIKISLVVATIGRETELIEFLESLVNQIYSKSKFEVIIVDQNDSDFLIKIIEEYSKVLQIVHIRSKQKGLSYNRNLGIIKSKGTYISVPDDDCQYYPDTLDIVAKYLEKVSPPHMIIGKVFDRNRQAYIFKKTPSEQKSVNKSNFYRLVSSITLFFEKSEIKFDENFGIGSKYHSNEDGDLILQFLNKNRRIVYCPDVECNHPPYSSSNMSLQKLYLYGIGFGALCKKHLSLLILILYFKVIAFQLIMLCKHLVLFDKENSMRRKEALLGRLAGFFCFKPS